MTGFASFVYLQNPRYKNIFKVDAEDKKNKRLKKSK